MWIRCLLAVVCFSCVPTQASSVEESVAALLKIKSQPEQLKAAIAKGQERAM